MTLLPLHKIVSRTLLLGHLDTKSKETGFLLDVTYHQQIDNN